MCALMHNWTTLVKYGRVKRIGLPVPEGDSALGQIVRRQFQSYLVASQDADAIPPQPARQVGQDQAFVLKLHAAEPPGEFLLHGAGYFDAVLFAHKPPVGLADRRAGL